MQPSAIIPAFDAYLAARGLRFDAVIIGGSALVLLGVVTRTTDDCDVLDPRSHPPCWMQHAPSPLRAASGQSG